MEALMPKLSSNATNVFNFKAETKADNTQNQQKFNEALTTKRNEVDKTNYSKKKPKPNKEGEKDNVNKSKKKEDKNVNKNEDKKVRKENKKDVREKTTDENNITETKRIEEEFEQIAKKLGISVEVLKTVLQNLNIEHLDLKNNLDDIKTIIKNIFELDSDADILKDSKLSNIIKEIKDILSDDKNIEEDVKDNSKKVENTLIVKENGEKEDIGVDDFLENKPIENDTVETSKVDEGKTNSENKKESNEKDSKPQKAKVVIETKENKIDIEYNNIEIGQKDMLKNEKIADINTDGKLTKNLDTKNIMKQIVEHTKVVLTEDKSEMIIKLKPDNLGKLTLKVVTEEGIVVAKFNAESQKVKEAIEANLDDLKQSMKEQGLQLDSVEVSVGQDSANEQQNLFKQEVTKNSVYRKNMIDKIMKEIQLEKLNINDAENPYMISESKFDYIA